MGGQMVGPARPMGGRADLFQRFGLQRLHMGVYPAAPDDLQRALSEVDLTQEGESVLGEEADSPLRPMLPDAPLPFGFSVEKDGVRWTWTPWDTDSSGAQCSMFGVWKQGGTPPPDVPHHRTSPTSTST